MTAEHATPRLSVEVPLLDIKLGYKVVELLDEEFGDKELCVAFLLREPGRATTPNLIVYDYSNAVLLAQILHGNVEIVGSSTGTAMQTDERDTLAG